MRPAGEQTARHRARIDRTRPVYGSVPDRHGQDQVAAARKRTGRPRLRRQPGMLALLGRRRRTRQAVQAVHRSGRLRRAREARGHSLDEREHRTGDHDVRRQPAASVRNARAHPQERPARAARKPAGVRQLLDERRADAMERRRHAARRRRNPRHPRRGNAVQPVRRQPQRRRRRMSVERSVPSRIPSRHRELDGGRLQQLHRHVQSRRRRTGPVGDHGPDAARPDRKDRRHHPLWRTAGRRRHLPRSLADRHGHLRRGRRARTHTSCPAPST